MFGSEKTKNMAASVVNKVAGGARINANMVKGVTPSTVASRARAPDSWKHVDTKFGLHMSAAEAHRKALSMRVGAPVMKVLANFQLKEWHFHMKVK